MSQFNLTWDNTDVVSSPNSTNQRASYRRRTPLGAWITAGFTPANDFSVSITNTLSPTLLDNVVYQFKVEDICTSGGPTINDNGIQDQIQFACINPSLINTDIQSSATIDVTGTDITKVLFTLKRTSDDSIVSSQVVNRIGNSVSATVTGLTASTQYYWTIVLYAVVNGIEVSSSSIGYIDNECGNYTFTTSAAPPPSACIAPSGFSAGN